MGLKLGDKIWGYTFSTSSGNGFKLNGLIRPCEVTVVEEFKGGNWIVETDKGKRFYIHDYYESNYFLTKEECISSYNSKVENEIDRLQAHYEKTLRYLKNQKVEDV